MPSKKSQKTSLTPAQKTAEIQRRVAAITPAAIADGHAHQLELLTCDAQSICLMCSRRAGKSIGCVALCVLTALKTSDVRCLYLSLTEDQSAPRYKECRDLLDKFGIPYTPHDGSQTVALYNKSEIRFTGTDDRRRAAAFFGGQFASGIVVIDEAQSDPGMLSWLLEEVLGPMVDETTVEKPIPGRIVVAGVVPESAAGDFWKLWSTNYDDISNAHRSDAGWKCMAWGRSDNPHETNFRDRLNDTLKRSRLAETDPIIQRNWFGRRVFDRNVTAYRYSPKRDSYAPVITPWDDSKLPANDNSLPLGTMLAVEPPAGVDTFAIGIDPASRRDSCAIVLWGFGRSSPDVYQIAEYVTVPASGIRQDQWVDVVKQLKTRYRNIVGAHWDAGSAAQDILLQDHHLNIEAVKKGPGSVKARVERTASLLGMGRVHIIAGSQLETQLQTVRWDQSARERGKWELLSQIPNDVSDGGDYGLVGYFDASDAKKPAPESYAQLQERLYREAMTPPAEYGYQEDPALAQTFGALGE